MADYLRCDFAIIHKERKKANQISKMVLVGDVKGRICILVDDIADTCGTLVAAAKELIENGGAIEVHALITHPILSGNALSNLSDCIYLSSLVVTNTIPINKDILDNCSKLKVIDISATLAEAIRRISNGESVRIKKKKKKEKKKRRKNCFSN